MGCLLAAGAAFHAAAAPAAPVALLDAPNALDVAVAGDEVLVSAVTPRNFVRLRAVPAAGGPARELLAVPRPGRGWFVEDTRLSSSSRLTALLVAFVHPDGSFQDWRVYAGPPAGPLSLIHRVRLRRGRHPWRPIDVDVHDDDLLMRELLYPGLRFRSTVLEPGSPPARVPQGRFGTPTVVAGDDVAYVDLGGRADSPASIRIVDWRSGRERGSVRLPWFSGEVDDRNVDLAEGGRVVAALDGRLVSAGPGEPARRVSGSTCANLIAPRLAGEQIAAVARSRSEAMRAVLVDPGAGTLRPLGAPSSALNALAADKETVAWLANGCVLAAGVQDAGPAGPPAPGPCPRSEVVLREGDGRLRGRMLGVSVYCVAAPSAGCRGEVLLGRGGGWAGRARFRMPAGERRAVQVRLSPRGHSQVQRQFRRFGHALLHFAARVVDGRVSRGAGTANMLIEPPG